MPFNTPAKQKAWQKKYRASEAGRKKVREANSRWRIKNKPYHNKFNKAWKKAQGKNYYREKLRYTIYKPTRKEPLNCEACGVPFASMKKGSQCDHDHATNLFRGWLCVNCNVALGYAKDSRVILQKLINYLDKCEMLS
jgi:Recombination endonuclease VII